MDPNSQPTNSNNSQAQGGYPEPNSVNPAGFSSSQDVVLNNQSQDNTFQIPQSGITPEQTYQPPQQSEPVTARSDSYSQGNKRELPIFMQDNSPPAVEPEAYQPPQQVEPVQQQTQAVPQQSTPYQQIPEPPQQFQAQSPQAETVPHQANYNQFNDQQLPVTGIPATQQPVMNPVAAPMVARPAKKKRSKIKMFFLIILFLAVSGLLAWGAVKLVGVFNKDEAKQTAKVETSKAYTSNKLEFKTKIPTGWDESTRLDGGLDVVEFKDLSSEANGVTAPSAVFIRLKNMPADQTSEEFFNKYQAGISKGFDKFTLINSQLITIDGLSAKSIEAEIEQSGQKQKTFFYLIFDGTNGFTITQSATIEQLIDVSDDFKTMIDSFDSTIGQPSS
ncbi:hypothetical protein KBB17_00265 [Candidatus Saccharibacteria bacterium]|jgi:hypothetical protein|nr:hypothetical protein [Candidatus Saccharibacteria bacterium]MBP9131693.1 hypothetical protein [Candidatus Saccharibacteria bacterium]